MPRYEHLLLIDAAETARYTATRARGPKFRTPPRERAAHAAHLLGSLEQARAARERFPQRIGTGFYESPGLTLTFESDPQFPLAYESLDLRKSNIELLAVKVDAEDRTIATVHVPDDKVNVLLRKLEAYRDYNPEAPRGRENRGLAESIANIKLATLQELWTDDPTLYPAANTIITWEVWLRAMALDEPLALHSLHRGAGDFGYEIISNALSFVDRTVVLVRGTREQLARGANMLGIIAEVRKAKVTADFFSSLSPAEQHSWSDDLVARLTPLAEDAPLICLLDTGVNQGHHYLLT